MILAQHFAAVEQLAIHMIGPLPFAILLIFTYQIANVLAHRAEVAILGPLLDKKIEHVWHRYIYYPSHIGDPLVFSKL